MSDDPIDINEIFNPTRVFIGYDLRTGEPVYLPRSSYIGRSAELIAPSGAGKTDRFMEDLRSLTLSPSGYVYYDFADTGFDQARLWDAYIAEFLSASIETPYADNVEEFRGITRAFVGRHGYAVVGGPAPPIRINPLRRCVFPDGSQESVEDVVGRMERVFGAQYDDYRDRVLFRRILRMVVALLAAAGRELRDWSLLLGDDPMFRQFVITEMERLGTAGDHYVVRQRENLAALFALSPRDRREEVASFVNSFEPFAAGAIAAFFSNENFPLEEVVYGGRRLFLSVSGLNGTEQKKFIMRVVWAACDTLIAKRRFMDQAPIGVEFIDEISWLPVDFFDVLTRRRNYRWSSLTARQDVRQFENLGFKNADRLSEASVATRMLWKVATLDEAKELALRMDPIEPDGWWIERIVESLSAAETNGSSIAHTQSTTIVDTQTKSTGWADSTQYDADGAVTGTSKGTSGSDGLTRGSHVGDGTAAGTSHGTTTTVTRSPQLFRLSFDEQQSLRGQALIRKPRHVAIVDSDGTVRPVLMNRARQLPFDETGQLVLETYVGLNNEIHEARTVRVLPFNPPVHVLSAAKAGAGRPGAAREKRTPAARAMATDPGPASGDDPRGAGTDRSPGRDVPAVTAPASPDEVSPLCLPTLAPGNRRGSILWLAACARFLTVVDVMNLLGTTYDTASRELGHLSGGSTPLLDVFRPPVARGQGNVPAIYILNGAGARSLVEEGAGTRAGELQRIVKNVATRRRDVEAGNPTQIRHALAVTHAVSLLWRGIRDRDPAAEIDDVFYDRELICPLPAADVAERLPLPERDRLVLSADGTMTAYIPDFFFTVAWAPEGGPRRREAFALEVETGYGQRDPRSIGAQKAAKVGVAVRDLHRTGKLGPLALPAGTDVRVLFWVREATYEAGVAEGALAVQHGQKNPIFTTNGDLVALTAPAGTEKKDLPATIQELSRRFLADDIWQWVKNPTARVALVTQPGALVGGATPRK